MPHGWLSKMLGLLAADLERIYSIAKDDFTALAGKKIFLTGGTGFFGKWLLYAFAYANSKLPNPAQLCVLSRNSKQFIADHPAFNDHKDIKFITGDVLDFSYPDGHYDIIIHAATEASAKLNSELPQQMLDTTINGTKRVLSFATQCQATKILLTSSGAVYGAQPANMERIPEDFLGGPNTLDVRSAYAEGKRLSELLAALHAKQTGQQVLVARCFAFLGPFLPLDTHFAVGNFINDCLNGRDIIIKGDGTTCRSYLYAADLVVWLLNILVGGKNLQAYNVGSEHSISISDLAQNVLAVWNESPSLQKFRKNKIGYSVLGVPSGQPPEKYIPCTQRARAELGLTETTVLQEAILKTFLFHLRDVYCSL